MERIISKFISHKLTSCLIGKIKICITISINMYFHLFIVDIAMQRITIKVVDIYALRISFMDDRKDLSIRMANGR